MNQLPQTVYRPYKWVRRNAGQLIYERRYRVRTAELIELDELGIAGHDRGYYVAAGWRTLRQTLPRKVITARDVFVDFGSGMGRMVLEAARYPFGRVIGVELSEELVDIARDNVRRTRQRLRCRDIETVHADVLDFQIPDDVSVVFFNNPFQGIVFATVVERLIGTIDRNPRRVVIIYYNPVEEEYLLETGRCRRLRTRRHARRRADDGTPFGKTSVYVLE